eukprot:CAMPEP_0198285706 /NCGR_PEP_ID=MMETSP1449-20131203/4943_1 /TAXON_ID=420275 /ORGANISM="Attheya septentrionalis, Strain CCMP2084" /LENGTH=1137 /DNA_ID=CAMNT_0043983217 /DNA_START=238 /DNA_END=3647 /DNA_ORIENTATION=-
MPRSRKELIAAAAERQRASVSRRRQSSAASATVDTSHDDDYRSQLVSASSSPSTSVSSRQRKALDIEYDAEYDYFEGPAIVTPSNADLEQAASSPKPRGILKNGKKQLEEGKNDDVIQSLRFLLDLSRTRERKAKDDLERVMQNGGRHPVVVPIEKVESPSFVTSNLKNDHDDEMPMDEQADNLEVKVLRLEKNLRHLNDQFQPEQNRANKFQQQAERLEKESNLYKEEVKRLKVQLRAFETHQKEEIDWQEQASTLMEEAKVKEQTEVRLNNEVAKLKSRVHHLESMHHDDKDWKEAEKKALREEVEENYLKRIKEVIEDMTSKDTLVNEKDNAYTTLALHEREFVNSIRVMVQHTPDDDSTALSTGLVPIPSTTMNEQQKIIEQLKDEIEELKNLPQKNETLSDAGVGKEIADSYRISELEREAREDRDRISELEEEIDNLKEELTKTTQEKEELTEDHDQSIRAIQRVLADVTSRRDKKIEKLQERLDQALEEKAFLEGELKDNSLNVSNISALSAASTDTTGGNAILESFDQKKIYIIEAELENSRSIEKSLKSDLKRKSGRIASLEKEVSRLKSSKSETVSSQQESGEQTVDNSKTMKLLEDEAHNLKAELNERKTTEKLLSKEVKAKEQEVGVLRSQVNDLQAAVKAEGSKTAQLTTELNKVRNGQITDESFSSGQLKTELGDLKAKNEALEKENVMAKKRLDGQRVLQAQLKMGLHQMKDSAQVQSGCSTQDSKDSLGSLQNSLASMLCVLEPDSFTNNFSEVSGGVSLNDAFSSFTQTYNEPNAKSLTLVSEGRHAEESMKELRRQLEERTETIASLEKSLKSQTETMNKLQDEMENMRKESEEEMASCQAELSRLRDACASNLVSLHQKEEELQVFRETLDPNTSDSLYKSGYISDDGSEDDNLTGSADFNGRNHNALAAMFCQTGRSDMANAISNEGMEAMKLELATVRREKQRVDKNLRVEKDSLANAKMIISSLEQSNKTMLEDLRNRLHNSNTAISSLLEKSLEQEKTTFHLRSELARMQQVMVESDHTGNGNIRSQMDSQGDSVLSSDPSAMPKEAEITQKTDEVDPRDVSRGNVVGKTIDGGFRDATSGNKFGRPRSNGATAMLQDVVEISPQRMLRKSQNR